MSIFIIITIIIIIIIIIGVVLVVVVVVMSLGTVPFVLPTQAVLNLTAHTVNLFSRVDTSYTHLL